MKIIKKAKFNLRSSSIVFIFCASIISFLFTIKGCQASVPVFVVDGELRWVHYIGKFSTDSQSSIFGGDETDLANIIYQALMEEAAPSEDWNGSITDQDSLKTFLMKAIQEAIMEADTSAIPTDLDWMTVDERDSLKTFFAKAFHEAIMLSEKEASDGNTENELVWLQNWTPDTRRSESLKDFIIDLTEEALMRVENAYSDELDRELSAATMKDFLLFYKDSNEQFMMDLMTAVSEKQRIDLEELQKYELAKIEKAREDVNKLTYEVYRELVDESLIYQDTQQREIIRGLGLKEIIPQGETANSCPFGVLVPTTSDGAQCMIIKKEGRVINNVDSFINEESIQKARDFLMCYLAPWRHFPVGEDYYFAASAEETQAILDENNGRFRDGTVFGNVPATARSRNGIPFCGAQRTEFILGQPSFDINYPFDETHYSGFKTELYVELQGMNICEAALEKGSEPNLARLCREAIREEMDPICNTEDICEAARVAADESFTYDYIDANGNSHDTTGRPDLFEHTIVEDENATSTYSKSQTFENYKNLLCPSDQMKETLKRDLLMEMARKYQFIYDTPPERWYYAPYNSASGGDKTRCSLILGNLGYDVEGIIGVGSNERLSSQTLLSYKIYQELTWKPDLEIALAYRPDPSDVDYNRYNANPYKNSLYGVRSFLSSTMEKIKSDYKSSRAAEYLVGEGLRSDKYLIGFSDEQTEKYYFINTENIISPALFLKEKVAAATQAQFDLAQMAWKQSPDAATTTNWSCPDPYATSTTSNTIQAIREAEFGDPPGPYDNLRDICINRRNGDQPGLSHGWYLVDLTPGEIDVSKKEYECRWPQFNDITCDVFGYTTTQAIKEYEMPKELPAPWEDINSYMQIPEEYKGWLEGDVEVTIGENASGTPITITKTGEELGLRKSPPAFDIQEYANEYPDLTTASAYPEIYGKAYGNDNGIAMPARSDDYYINKWYKGITQLYEKPMSEILRTWFRQE